MKPISLASSYGAPMAAAMPEKDSVYYPSASFETKEGELELPDSGVITLRFRVSRETEDKKEGKCRYELEFKEVLGVKADPMEKEEFKPESSDDAVEKAFKGKR